MYSYDNDSSFIRLCVTADNVLLAILHPYGWCIPDSFGRLTYIVDFDGVVINDFTMSSVPLYEEVTEEVQFGIPPDWMFYTSDNLHTTKKFDDSHSVSIYTEGELHVADVVTAVVIPGRCPYGFVAGMLVPALAMRHTHIKVCGISVVVRRPYIGEVCVVTNYDSGDMNTHTRDLNDAIDFICGSQQRKNSDAIRFWIELYNLDMNKYISLYHSSIEFEFNIHGSAQFNAPLRKLISRENQTTLLDVIYNGSTQQC